ncbi:hypothetical protein M3J09_001459 [Ascochyta lentis]
MYAALPRSQMTIQLNFYCGIPFTRVRERGASASHF